MTSQPRVVVAFSGGLDTSYCLVAMREQGCEVLTATVDTGGLRPGEADEIRLRAEQLGTAEHIVVDAREALYDRFVSKLIKANYLRHGVYPSCVGVERMVQAEEVVKLATSLEAEAIVHGSTGAGGDHVRWDVVIKTLAPQLQIVTPIRDEELKREQEAAYLRERGFDTPEKTTMYSINAGMAGTTIGGGETYGTWEYLPDEAWTFTRSVDDAPAVARELIVHFEHGIPTSVVDIDGTVVVDTAAGAPSYALLETLNEIGAEHGVGRGIYTAPATIMGNPARLGFEAPGMLTLIAAHRELERAVLTYRQQTLKASLGSTYGDALHEGVYYDPMMSDLEAFLDSTQQRVTGDVRVRLHKGNMTVLGSRSEHSLLDVARERGATYGYGSSLWTGADARSFAHLYGLQGALARAADTRGQE